MTKQLVLTLGLLTVIVVSAPLTARAQSKPIQLSLLTPVQIFPEQTPIAGLRLNVLYGRNVSVQGLDVGLVNHTTTGHFNARTRASVSRGCGPKMATSPRQMI